MGHLTLLQEAPGPTVLTRHPNTLLILQATATKARTAAGPGLRLGLQTHPRACARATRARWSQFVWRMSPCGLTVRSLSSWRRTVNPAYSAAVGFDRDPVLMFTLSHR